MDFTVKPLTTAPPHWYQHRKLWIIGGITLLAIVAILIMLSGSGFAESAVSITVSGNSEVSSGEEISYKISVKNSNTIALASAQVTLFYPTGSPRTTDTIELGTLARGTSQEKTVHLYFVGDLGAIKTTRATLSFIPAGLSSKIQKSTDIATTITRLDVPLTLVAPPTVVSGEPVNYIVDYRNQTTNAISELKMRILYPEGFSAGERTPRPAVSSTIERADEWALPTLAPGDAGRISVVGTLSGREREGKQVKVVLQKKINGEYVDFERYEASSLISAPALSVSMTVNNTADYVAHLGDTLSYSILLENNSDADVPTLTMRAQLEGTMLDLSSVKATGYFDARTKTMNWNSSAVPELALLRAHQSIKIPLEVRLRQTFPASSVGARDSLVRLSTTAESFTLTARNDLVTKISSAPVFSERLSLSDGGAIAQGPYPPRVGQKTSYIVHWRLDNPANDLKDAKISAMLQPGVEMVGIIKAQGTQSTPVYDAQSQTMTWSIGTTSGGIGTTFPAIELWYQIAQTPSVNQEGNAVELVKSIRFEATDALTGEKFSQTGRDMSTRDVSDSKESGNVMP